MGKTRNPEKIFNQLSPDWLNRIASNPHHYHYAQVEFADRQKNLEKYCKRQQEGRELFTGEDLDGYDLADNFGALKSGMELYNHPVVHLPQRIPKQLRYRIRDPKYFGIKRCKENDRFLKEEENRDWNAPLCSTPPELLPFANAS